MQILSIIIPYGLSTERDFIAKRVEYKAKNLKSDGKVQYLFVEGYSSCSLQDSLELKDLIESQGHRHYKDTRQQENGAFSLASCRNYGARFVQTPTMMVLDVDYVFLDSTLDKILKLIQTKGIVENPASFLVLPCAFLNELGTQKFISGELKEEEIQSSIVFNDKTTLDFLTPTSSSIVLNTYTFLELGGYGDFVGFGYEDFDFFSRLLRHCATFEIMPKELKYFARNWNLKDFRGFRAWYALVGLEAMFYGISLVHLYHERPNQNGYLSANAINKNKKLFLSNLNRKSSLDPLICAKAREKVCILYSEKSNNYRILQKPCVFLGEPIAAEERMFFDEEEFNAQRFLDFKQKHAITRFLCLNPYAREQIAQIYQFMRENQIPFYVFERGAFPDAWFFDDSGFLCDSNNYDEKLWNHEITSAQKDSTLQYIKGLLESNVFLEDKNDIIAQDELKRTLGIRHKRVIFVPLQVECDTAILHFSPYFSYEEFLETLNELAGEYFKENVVFVCKKHPLGGDLDKKLYKNLIFAPDNCNFLSLIDLSEMCVLLNSGVGMYAMIAKKPAIVCARAFYAFDGLNLQAQSKEELKAQIDSVLQNGFEVNEAKMLAFIRYLREDFYSYLLGESVLLKRQDGNLFRRTTEFYFYQMNLGGQKFLQGKKFEKQNYTLDSLCYLPFAYEINQDKNSFLQKKSKSGLFLAFLSWLEDFKSYRKLRKLLREPRNFFLDSKNPLFIPIKKLVSLSHRLPQP